MNEHKPQVTKRVCYMAGSFLTEGYVFRTNAVLPGSHYVKMKHTKNGNIITIVGNFTTGQITIKRNGRVRHTETV